MECSKEVLGMKADTQIHKSKGLCVTWTWPDVTWKQVSANELHEAFWLTFSDKGLVGFFGDNAWLREQAKRSLGEMLGRY